MNQKLNIAVIGGGVAGVVTSYLLQKKHKVTLFERGSAIGGHTNTVVVQNGSSGGTAVDTGFIVLNDKTYPLFHRFLKQLNVSVRDSDMSFGYECEHTNFSYAGTNIAGLLADPLNLARPRFFSMLVDISRFSTNALSQLAQGRLDGLTLGEYLEQHRYGEAFQRDYLLPIAAAIWSSPDKDILQFPAATLVGFFKNHGLLSLKDRPKWQTVVGGSHSYLRAFEKNFFGSIRTNSSIRCVERHGDYSAVTHHDGSTEHFDKVVFATHADQALGLLADASLSEKRALGAWNYHINKTVLHTDSSILPQRKRAWASWNYRRETSRNGSAPVSVTYHMNRLQGLKLDTDFCVSLNTSYDLDPKTVIAEFDYEHPCYTLEAVRSQQALASLNGSRGTYYCGSYFGYGFHEDAVRSGVEVAKAFGVEL